MEVLTGATEQNMGSACRRLLEQGPELVVVTMGSRGCYICNPQGGVRIGGFSVATVDATGCGDAFIAGLLSQLVTADTPPGSLSLEDLKLFGRYANAVGALTTQTKGVIPALPSKDQVEDLLRQSNTRNHKL